MKKFSRVFIAVGILFIAVALLCLFSFLFRTVYDHNLAYEETTISKFKICAVENPIENGDTSCGNSFPVDTLELYACGYVNADYLKPGDFVELTIYLNKDKVPKAIYENKLDDRFTIGNFCRKIIVPHDSQPGSYHVTVYFYRKIVASSQFELK